MTINHVRHSKAARDIALACLSERLPSSLGHPPSIPQGSLGMLPVYSIAKHRLEAREYHKSWRAGWRYFWLHPDRNCGAIVNILHQTLKSPKLISYSFGRAALNLNRHLNKAVDVFDDDGYVYRPRLLQLGPVRMEAIWLNTQKPDEPDQFLNLHTDQDDDAFISMAVRRYQRMKESAN
ncbi:MAG: hypothetical protein AABY88_06745 [Pseudomonadota bacterium]